MLAHDFTFSPAHEHDFSVHPAQCIACLRRPSAEVSHEVQAVEAVAVSTSSAVVPPTIAQRGEAKPVHAAVNVRIDAAAIYAARAGRVGSQPPEASQQAAKPTVDAAAIYAARAEQSKLSTAQSWNEVAADLNHSNASVLDPDAVYAKRRADLRNEC